MRFKLSFGIGLAAFATLTSSFGFSDPSLGRWRAKATGAGAEERTLAVEQLEGDWIRITSVSALADATRRRVSFRLKRDGQDYPVARAESYNSVSSVRIDGQTLETVFKRDGREVRRCMARFAADGRSSQCRCVSIDGGRKAVSATAWELEVRR